jgi:hypothetical protein
MDNMFTYDKLSNSVKNSTGQVFNCLGSGWEERVYEEGEVEIFDHQFLENRNVTGNISYVKMARLKPKEESQEETFEDFWVAVRKDIEEGHSIKSIQIRLSKQFTITRK